MYRTSNIRKGFTLIELLVVIAIIAILAAILFPVFAQARSKARQSAGLSNTKQIALGILQYSQDYDEKWPLAGYSGTSTLNGVTVTNQYMGLEWQNTIQPYVKNGQIFESPGDAGVTGWGAGADDFKYSDGKFSLMINDYLSHTMGSSANGYGDGQKQDVASTGTSQSYVVAPADCILVAEGHGGWVKGRDLPVIAGWNGTRDIQSKWLKEHTISGNFTPFFSGASYQADVVFDSGTAFYNGGGNVAFCDGHSKWYKYIDSSGKPTLCSTLPWAKHMDPQQRRGLESANYCGGDNPPGRAWGAQTSNWY